MQTKKQFIAHCVAQGNSAAIALACWHEYLAEGPAGDQQLWAEGAPVTLTPAEADSYYATFASLAQVTAQGIEFDNGCRIFDLNGNPLV